MFLWKEGASKEAIASALAELRGLKGEIAGIVDLSGEANFSDRAQGYTHGLVMRLTHRAALEAYYPHPEHRRVVQNFISPIRADTLAFDYEF